MGASGGARSGGRFHGRVGTAPPPALMIGASAGGILAGTVIPPPPGTTLRTVASNHAASSLSRCCRERRPRRTTAPPETPRFDGSAGSVLTAGRAGDDSGGSGAAAGGGAGDGVGSSDGAVDASDRLNSVDGFHFGGGGSRQRWRGLGSSILGGGGFARSKLFISSNSTSPELSRSKEAKMPSTAVFGASKPSALSAFANSSRLTTPSLFVSHERNRSLTRAQFFVSAARSCCCTDAPSAPAPDAPPSTLPSCRPPSCAFSFRIAILLPRSVWILTDPGCSSSGSVAARFRSCALSSANSTVPLLSASNSSKRAAIASRGASRPSISRAIPNSPRETEPLPSASQLVKRLITFCWFFCIASRSVAVTDARSDPAPSPPRRVVPSPCAIAVAFAAARSSDDVPTWRSACLFFDAPTISPPPPGRSASSTAPAPASERSTLLSSRKSSWPELSGSYAS